MPRIKKILAALLALALIYCIWLGSALLHYKKYKALQPGTALEIQGVYHIHSRFSDGWKNVDKIAKLAALDSLDFLILTDHGNPNFPSLASEGWKDGVLVLSGSELSTSRGHLTALGFRTSHTIFPQNAEDAVHEISALGGFSVIAHPYSKVHWSWGEFIEYSGLEIINADAMLKEDILQLVPYLPALLLRPEYALLKILDPPSQNLRKWDELNRVHPLYGYYSTDAHLFYRALFSLLRLHILLQNPLSRDFETAKDQVFTSLRRGNFYNAIEAAGEAKGFRFWGENAGQTKPMGEIFLTSPITLHLSAPFSFAKEARLIHDGKMILSSRQNAFTFQATEPGAYRVEVYLKEKSPLGKNVPWIISNPIFLRKDNR